MAKKNALDNLVDNPKKAIAISIILVVAIILIAFLWKKIKVAIITAKSKIDNVNLINEEITSTGIPPSYSDSQYNVYAQQLYTAMKGLGTDENAIYTVFRQMKNRVDILKLFAAFGTRDGQDLYEWMAGDLSSWNFNKINNILTDNGVDYQF